MFLSISYKDTHRRSTHPTLMDPVSILIFVASAKNLFPDSVTRLNANTSFTFNPFHPPPQSEPNLIPPSHATWYNHGPTSSCSLSPAASGPSACPQSHPGLHAGACMPMLCAYSLYLAVRKGDSRLQQSPQGPLCSEMLLPLLLAVVWLGMGPAGRLSSQGARGAGEGRVRGRRILLQAQALGAGPMTGLPAGWLLPTTPLWLLLLLGLLSSPSHKGEFWRPSTTLPSQEEDVQRSSSSWQGKKHRARAISGPCPSAHRSPGYS